MPNISKLKYSSYHKAVNQTIKSYHIAFFFLSRCQNFIKLLSLFITLSKTYYIDILYITFSKLTTFLFNCLSHNQQFITLQLYCLSHHQQFITLLFKLSITLAKTNHITIILFIPFKLAYNIRNYIVYQTIKY